MSERDSRIRERAYALWERDGKPQGRSIDHWLKAERELFAAPKPLAKGAKAPPKAAKPKAASKAKSPAAKANGKARPAKAASAEKAKSPGLA